MRLGRLVSKEICTYILHITRGGTEREVLSGAIGVTVCSHSHALYLTRLTSFNLSVLYCVGLRYCLTTCVDHTMLNST